MSGGPYSFRDERAAKLPGAVSIGVDRAGESISVYCEARREPDGSITILDIYEIPHMPKKPD